MRNNAEVRAIYLEFSRVLEACIVLDRADVLLEALRDFADNELVLLQAEAVIREAK